MKWKLHNRRLAARGGRMEQHRRGVKYLPVCAADPTHVPVRNSVVSTLWPARLGTCACAALGLYKRKSRDPSSHSITPTQNVHISRDKGESYPFGEIRVAAAVCTCPSRSISVSLSPSLSLSLSSFVASLSHGRFASYPRTRTNTYTLEDTESEQHGQQRLTQGRTLT